MLDFVSVGGHLLVGKDANFIDLHGPRVFAVPTDFNYYRFDLSCVRQMARHWPRDAGFIYQRMSIGNISGVTLSRRFKLPLVLEYNGSEAWVARNWGQPLVFQRLAEDTEECALRHAHLVVTVSDVLKDELIARGVEPERIVMYPNCIDPAMFDPARFGEQNAPRFDARRISPKMTVSSYSSARSACGTVPRCWRRPSSGCGLTSKQSCTRSGSSSCSSVMVRARPQYARSSHGCPRPPKS